MRNHTAEAPNREVYLALKGERKRGKKKGQKNENTASQPPPEEARREKVAKGRAWRAYFSAIVREKAWGGKEVSKKNRKKTSEPGKAPRQRRIGRKKG